MAKRKMTERQPLTTAQRLGSLIKSARDIMRKDKGLNGDLDRLPMLTWIMFLTGILQTSLRLCKIQDVVDHFPEDHPGRGRTRVRTIHQHGMTVRNVDARPNRLFCGIPRGIGAQSVVTTTL